MRISVIIPVYNADAYVQKAVESALLQPETGEVILVEDGSPDDSLAVCRVLAAKYDKVYLYRHPNGVNHGAGAARNLAIQKSSCEYVAFLDADDFYLPERFSMARDLLTLNRGVDGVYEAVGRYVEDDRGAERWREAGFREEKPIAMRKRVPPNKLFTALVLGGSGGVSLDGLIVRRGVFEKTGWFDEHLRLHQDTAMIWKMAAMAHLVPGRLEQPVALARIHDRNRISEPLSESETYRGKMLFWSTMWHWSQENLNSKQQRLILGTFLNRAMFLPRSIITYPSWMRGFRKRRKLLLLLIDYPSLIFEVAFWRRFFPNMRRWKRRESG
jgi:glycosyltransferase involved in cell wall biosynthesis